MTNLATKIGETSIGTTGTGTITLGGALSGYLAFDDAQGLGTGSLTIDIVYLMHDASDATIWEIGKGTYTKSGATKTITRPTTPRLSSASGAKINFSGTIKVYVVADALSMGPEGAARSYALTTGTSTAYVGSFRPSISGLVNGMEVEVEWHTTCGASPTFTPRTGVISAKNIRGLRNGSMLNVPSGTLISGRRNRLVYRAASDTWDIVGSHTCSGSYTPTLVSVTNVDSTSNSLGQWLYVDGIVTVSMSFDADATAAGSALTEVGIPLPINSDFTSNRRCCGTGLDIDRTMPGFVYGDTTNDRAGFRYSASSTVSKQFWLQFTYLVN